VGVVLKQWQDLNTEIVQNTTSDFIFVDFEKIPEEITDIKMTKAPLVAYEVGDKQLGKQLLNMGVTMLETFELEQLSQS
jgi:2-keto-3-deoxy-L-rhamnonate aldolase RhmA